MRFYDRLVHVIGFNRIHKLKHLRRYHNGLKMHEAKFPTSPDERVCVLVGSADYGNIGDIAISEAQLAFLRNHFPGTVIDIIGMRFLEYRRALERHLTRRDVLCFQGGGNMNDLYPWFEYERCEALATFPHIRSVIMPQTIHYRDWHSPLLHYSQKVYARCTDLHIFARERRSEELMKRTYPDADVELVPDIVLTLDPSPFIEGSPTRDGITVILRSDRERSLDDQARARIEDIVIARGMRVSHTDTASSANHLTADDRRRILGGMLTTFASSQAVVTDRLHGMVFAAITETPCVVFANNNHKIQGVYQWIKDLPYIRFVDDVDELPDALNAVMGAPAVYPRERMLEHFQPLIEVLR